jgi:hypothetical protein
MPATPAATTPAGSAPGAAVASSGPEDAAGALAALGARAVADAVNAVRVGETCSQLGANASQCLEVSCIPCVPRQGSGGGRTVSRARRRGDARRRCRRARMRRSAVSHPHFCTPPRPFHTRRRCMNTWPTALTLSTREFLLWSKPCRQGPRSVCMRRMLALHRARRRRQALHTSAFSCPSALAHNSTVLKSMPMTPDQAAAMLRVRVCV